MERRHQEQPDGGPEQRLSRSVWPPCPLLAARGRVGQHRAQHLADVDGLRGRELRLQRQHVPDLEHAAGRCDQGPIPPGPRAGGAGAHPGLRRHAPEHARRQGRPADRVHKHAAEPERHHHDVGFLPIGSARSEHGSSGHARRDDHRGEQRRHRQHTGERSAAGVRLLARRLDRPREAHRAVRPVQLRVASRRHHVRHEPGQLREARRDEQERRAEARAVLRSRRHRDEREHGHAPEPSDVADARSVPDPGPRDQARARGLSSGRTRRGHRDRRCCPSMRSSRSRSRADSSRTTAPRESSRATRGRPR